ncbi:hypothetical protein CKAH01_07398 [Colletotrichum kahawae]|uniref:Uncharacterized protein n=1 Tax=Colletotrichum kahawae TaxID=34407 RepID=A0AAD9Y4M7_COLKA|nr:hypothetical protein CKAH01_07398 [Colletotrichum kahawae]
MFWVSRSYRLRNMDGPRSREVFNEVTELMRHLAVKHGITRRSRSLAEKSYVDIEELRQMIDEDMCKTAAIDLTEQHHLAWLLGRHAALRPGSLGKPAGIAFDPDADEHQYLIWRDIAITRGRVPAGFDVKVLIRNSKTNKADPETRTNKTLKFVVKSPQQQSDLALSVPHRFLVIALRRQMLADYTTIDDSLSGNLAEIRIKRDILDQPVLLAGTPGGRGIQPGVVMGAGALTEYISRRGTQMGFKTNITFYSIRRQVSTEFDQVLGSDLAREIMSHDPDSRVLEAFYVVRLRTTDVASVALRELSNARDNEMRDEHNTLVMAQLSPEKVVNPLHAAQRPCAQVSACDITMEDNEISREHIYKRATTFNKRLLDMSLIDIDPNTSPGDGDASRANIDLDQPFGAKTGSDGDIPDVDDTESRLVIDDAQVEPDADELFVTQDEDDGTEMELPEEHGVSSALLDFTSATGKISYVEAVQQAMRLLLTNELSEDGGCE